MNYRFTNKHLMSSLLFGSLAVPAFGDASWDALSGFWHEPSNWSPNGVPTVNDDVFIGNLPAAKNGEVTISQLPPVVRSLTVTNGMNLEVNSVLLFIANDTLVSGVNVVTPGPPDFVNHSVLVVRGNGGTERMFDTNNLTLADRGRVIVDDAIVEVDNVMTTEAGTSVNGVGRLDFTQNGGTVLVNNGFISPDINLAGAPMLFRAVNNGLFDLDGTTGQGGISLSIAAIDGTKTSALTFEGNGLADPFDGEMRIAGGNTLTMDLANGWTLGGGGMIDFFSGNDTAGRLVGEDVTVRGTVNIGAGSVGLTQALAQWEALTTTVEFGASFVLGRNDVLKFQSPAGTAINAGTFELGEAATIDFEGPTTMNGGTFTNADGDGQINFRGLTLWGGTVNLAGLAQQWTSASTFAETVINADVLAMEAGVDNIWTLNNPLTINAHGLDSDFNDSGVAETETNFVIQSGNGFTPGKLTVNLTGSDATWDARGNITINGPGGNANSTSIAGSRVNLHGLTTVNGNTIFGTFFDLTSEDGGVGTILLNADATLRIAGGANQLNELKLGTILGPGTLRAPTDATLFGDGLIQAPIDFDGDAELLAVGGLLQISGPILDVGTLGVVGSDSTLQVLNPWDTSVTDLVELRGGLLKGATIFNFGPNGILGHGTITAQLDNISKVTAHNGTLILDNVNNKYDGSFDSGQLFALSGDLHLVGQAEPAEFNGQLSVGSGHEIFIAGFDMNFAKASIITLVENGTIRSDVHQTFDGNLFVFQLPATLQTDATFMTGSHSTLSDDLNLRGDTLLQAGISFTGTGELISHEILTFDHEASIDVSLTANGKVILEDGGVGHARVNPDAFLLDIVAIELAGNTPDLHDRLIVADNLTVRGATFDVDLLGYDPVAGDEFDVLDFATFTDLGHSLDLPTLTPGLAWDSSDFVTQGVLRVIPEPATAGLLALGLAPLIRRRRDARI